MIAAMKAQNERKIAKIIDIISITLRNVTELADLAIVRPPVIMNAMKPQQRGKLRILKKDVIECDFETLPIKPIRKVIMLMM